MSMFEDAIRAVLDDFCTPSHVRRIEAIPDVDAHPLWDQLEQSQLLNLSVAESEGGAGLSLAEVFPVLTLLGEYAAPFPVGQTILGRSLLRGFDCPRGPITFARQLEVSSTGWRLSNVVGGQVANYIICTRPESGVILLPASGSQRTCLGMFGSLDSDLHWKDKPMGTLLDASPPELHLLNASLHAALIAGAVSRVLAICLRYAEDRSQFGKQIGKFQAVQQQLSVMAESVAAARVAAELPFRHAMDFPTVAVAKSRTSEVAALVSAIAHAVHGALGVTEEYDLQLYTRRLHDWRMVTGAETIWNQRLGEYILGENSTTFAGFAYGITTANLTVSQE